MYIPGSLPVATPRLHYSLTFEFKPSSERRVDRLYLPISTTKSLYFLTEAGSLLVVGSRL
jgi:hypothetical protein